jgi:hypothetical protein
VWSPLQRLTVAARAVSDCLAGTVASMVGTWVTAGAARNLHLHVAQDAATAVNAGAGRQFHVAD